MISAPPVRRAEVRGGGRQRGPLNDPKFVRDVIQVVEDEL
jgi:hypothetical protein